MGLRFGKSSLPCYRSLDPIDWSIADGTINLHCVRVDHQISLKIEAFWTLKFPVKFIHLGSKGAKLDPQPNRVEWYSSRKQLLATLPSNWLIFYVFGYVFQRNATNGPKVSGSLYFSPQKLFQGWEVPISSPLIISSWLFCLYRRISRIDIIMSFMLPSE